MKDLPKKSKDAQRIIVALYLRKRREREHLRKIQSDDCKYPDFKEWKKDPKLWKSILSDCRDRVRERHNSLEVAKRAFLNLWN